MRHYESHLSEEDLLLAIDGELSGSRAEQVEEHLAACWDCRGRKHNFERTISNLVEARHAEFDSQVAPSAGFRASLKANLARTAEEPRSSDRGSLALTGGGARPAATNRVGRVVAAAVEAM